MAHSVVSSEPPAGPSVDNVERPASAARHHKSRKEDSHRPRESTKKKAKEERKSKRESNQAHDDSGKKGENHQKNHHDKSEKNKGDKSEKNSEKHHRDKDRDDSSRTRCPISLLTPEDFRRPSHVRLSTNRRVSNGQSALEKLLKGERK